MVEFRLHGRGGQGLVLMATMFNEAAFRTGHYARAFSLFGAERRGAPVTAFIRVSGQPLMPRCRVYHPDYVISLDPSFAVEELAAGLKENGTMLLNAASLDTRPFNDKVAGRFRLFMIDAAAIAEKYNLTVGGMPVVNTPMVGAMARVSGLATAENVFAAVEKQIPYRRRENVMAAEDGFHQVREVYGQW